MKRKWTEEEIKYIKENANKLTWSEMSKFLDCSINTVQKCAEKQGAEVTYTKSERWTKEEIELLREYSTKYVTKTIAKKLNKSITSVKRKAQREGIKLQYKKDIWKKWMIDYLKDNINDKSIRQIALFLNITDHQVRKKCNELGISYDTNRWTKEEEDILREYADKCHYSEITKLISNKTKGAIISKARQMNITLITEYKYLTEEEIKYLIDNWNKIPINELARQLKVPRATIYRYKRKYNLNDVGQTKKWTEETIEELRKYSKIESIDKLAKRFKTSKSAISCVASKYNIILLDGKRKWTDEKIEEIKELAKDNTINEISIKLDISPQVLSRILKRYDIKLVKTNSVKVRNWTEEELKQLKTLIEDGKSINYIATIINRTPTAVEEKAKKEKLISSGRKLWTKEEEELLKELWNEHNIMYISNKLKRSISAIKNKANELKLGRQFLTQDSLTIEEIAEVFKVRRNEIDTTWISLGLPVKIQKTTSVSNYKYVTIDDLFKFLEINQFLYNGANFEENILGLEPDWVKVKRKHDILYGFDYERSGFTKKKLLQENKYYLNENKNT